MDDWSFTLLQFDFATPAQLSVISMLHSQLQQHCRLGQQNSFATPLQHWFDSLQILPTARPPNGGNQLGFRWETALHQLLNCSNCTACLTSAMNWLTTSSTVYIRFNYLDWFEPVYSTAMNLSSPALTVAHAVYSTLLSNISSLLKESHENPAPCAKILRFDGGTILNIHYKSTSGYASGEWLTIHESTLRLSSLATALQSILTALLVIWKLVDLSTKILCQQEVEWVMSGQLSNQQWTSGFWTYKLHCTALWASTNCTALPRTNYILHWLTLYKQCTGSTVGRSAHSTNIYLRPGGIIMPGCEL